MRTPALHPRVLLAVAVGGAVGGLARWGVGTVVPPGWATVAVDLLGCLLVGALTAWLRHRASCTPRARDRTASLLHPLLGVGLLGGFTTFATWTTDVLALLDDGRTAEALGHAVGLPVLAVLATVVGLAAAHRLLTTRTPREAP